MELRESFGFRGWALAPEGNDRSPSSAAVPFFRSSRSTGIHRRVGSRAASMLRVVVAGLMGLSPVFAAGCGGGAIQQESTDSGTVPESPPSKRRFEPDELDQLRARAEQQGTVRVIVRLDVQHTPEGELSEDEVTRQRRSIRSAQKQLLRALESTDFQVNHRYTISPLIALSLSPGAVKALKGQSVVRHVNLDTADRPSATGSAS